jgi:hypothetical protein
MIPKDFPPSEMDQDTRRRRALAKVYSLLLRLAEQAEKETILPNLLSEKPEQFNDPNSIQGNKS